MSKTKSEENSDPNEDIIFIGSIQNTIITRSSGNVTELTKINK